MVRPERFELPTTWFVARYSIQLSYGRVVWELPMCGRLSSVLPFPFLREVWKRLAGPDAPSVSSSPAISAISRSRLATGKAPHYKALAHFAPVSPGALGHATSRVTGSGMCCRLGTGRLSFRMMAEREGFEPSMEFLTPYSLSRGAPSTGSAISPRERTAYLVRTVQESMRAYQSL